MMLEIRKSEAGFAEHLTDIFTARKVPPPDYLGTEILPMCDGPSRVIDASPNFRVRNG